MRHREGDPRLRPRREPDQRRQRDPGVAFPQLTEERRREYIKVARHKAEDASVSIRNIRRHAKETLDKLVKDGDVGEDEVASRGEAPRGRHPQVRRADRRAAQAQGGRAARGLTTPQPIARGRDRSRRTDSAAAGVAHGRAGRNLPSADRGRRAARRRRSSCCLLFAPWLFSFIVAVALVIAANEIVRALAGRGIHLVVVPLLRRRRGDDRWRPTGGASCRWWPPSASRCCWSLGWRLAPRAGRLRRGRRGHARWRCATPASWAAFAALHAAGRPRTAARSSPSWCSPSAATSAATSPACCSAGTRWRRAISPKKSWEGFGRLAVLRASPAPPCS